MSLIGRSLGPLLVIAGLAAACSSSQDQASPSTSSTIAPTNTSTTTTTTESPPPTEPRTITEIEFVPDPELSSPGAITIGSETIEFVFECHTEGAGDVLAIGVGTRDGKATRQQAIVQAFVGAPYVGVLDGGDLFELAIDRPAELFVQDSAISGSALRFVKVSDGSPGRGEAAGLGSVSIDCRDFAFGFPEGFPVVVEESGEDS